VACTGDDQSAQILNAGTAEPVGVLVDAASFAVAASRML
jgi:hypothetical protein